MNKKYDEQILEAIRNNDRRALQEIYNHYRELFAAWCVKNHELTQNESAELYQQVYVILYKNVMSGRLEKFTCQPMTYLCSIGKHLIMNQRRGNIITRAISIDDIEEEQEPLFIMGTVEEEEQRQMNKILVEKLLSKIGDPCARLLRMIFVEEMHMDDIIIKMNYSDKRVVRKRKSLCLKRLREMMQS